MRKMKKTLLLSFLAVLLLLVLSACGAKVNTTFTLNKDFSGSRVMTLTLATSDIRDYVSGGYDALKKTLESHLPPELTSKISKNTNGDAEVEITLSFDSKDDYIKKVTSLLALDTGKSINPEIIIEVQDGMFKQGYTIKENFNSIDLLGWLALGAIEDELTTQSRDNFFEHASTNVVFNGETISAYQNINVSDMVSNGMNSIDVTTVLTGGESSKREIIFRMNKDKAAEVDGLEDFMRGLTPDGGEFKRVEEEDTYTTIYGVAMQTGYGNDVLWIYTFSAANASEMVAKTNKVLNTDNTIFSFSITPNSQIPGKAVVEVTQLNDGSYFCDYGTSSWSYSAPLKNILVLNKSYSLTNGYDGFQSQIDTQDGGYNVISYTNAPMEYTQIFDWTISFDRIEIDTTISPLGSISRTVRYTINKPNGDIAGDALEKLVSENLGGMTYKNISDDVSYIYEVSGSASSPEKFCGVFGEYLYGDDNAVSKTSTKYQFYEGKVKSGNPFSTGYYIEDSFDLSDRLGAASSEAGIIYTVSYPFLQQANKQETESDKSTENTLNLKSSQSQTVFSGVNVKLSDYSTGISITGTVGVILFVVFIAFAVSLVLSQRAAILGFIEAQKQAKVNRPQSVPVVVPVSESARTLVGVGAASSTQQQSSAEQQNDNGEADLL